jgi:hypothetical protein
MALMYRSLATDAPLSLAQQYYGQADELLYIGFKATDTVMKLYSKVRNRRVCTLLLGNEVGALALKSAILCAIGRTADSSKAATEMLEFGNGMAMELEHREC